MPVSAEARNLLINLLQFNPSERIEWKDFFNHPLFTLYEKNNLKGLAALT